MADIQSNIDVNIDTSAAVANLRSLQRQISAFYTSLSSAGSAANGSIANMQQNLLNTINATGQFSAQLTKVKSTADSFTSSLEKNKLSLGQYFRYAGGASQTFSRMFKTEADVIDKTARERVKDLQTQYVRLGKNASGAIEAIKIRPLSLDMDHLATRTAMAAQKQQLLNQLLRQGSTQLLNFGKNTQWAGRQLMVGFTIPLSMLGTAAAKTFMDMEKQAIAFKRVYGDAFTTTAETAQALQSIRDLATEFTRYGVAAEKTMELAAQAAAAGKTGAELTAQVREANRLAVLGQVEQSQALETTMSISNAFGTATVDLTKKINFLNAVENQTVTSIEDLTIAVPKAGPVIKQLGGDVEDLAFFLTAMKEGGINASEGANALKSGLASLINPTEKSSAFLKGFGINVQGIVDANKGDVKGIVIDFAKALDTLDPLNRARAIEQMFGKFQFARLSTLFQNVIVDGNQASKVLELTGKSASELAGLASKELGTIAASSMFKFQKSVEDLRVQLAPLGETFLKIVTPVIEGIADILENFNKLDDRVKTFITGLVLVVGGLGPVLLMTFGLLANGVANIIKGFTLVRNLFNKTGDSGRFLGEQTDYMTQQQLEASAAASSLEQVHQKLEQRFTSEAIAINKLTAALQKAVTTQNAYKGMNTGRPAAVKKFANGGMVRGPGGPKDDLIPADLSNGEAVIDAETVRKNPRIIQALFAKKKIIIPGYKENNSSDFKVPVWKAKETSDLYKAPSAIKSQTVNMTWATELAESAAAQTAAKIVMAQAGVDQGKIDRAVANLSKKQASHIVPDVSPLNVGGAGIEVKNWKANNLVPDLGYVNNYINTLQQSSNVLENFNKTNMDTIAKELGMSMEEVQTELDNLKRGIQRPTRKAASVLQRVAQSDPSYQGQAAAAGLKVRLAGDYYETMNQRQYDPAQDPKSAVQTQGRVKRFAKTLFGRDLPSDTKNIVVNAVTGRLEDVDRIIAETAAKKTRATPTKTGGRSRGASPAIMMGPAAAVVENNNQSVSRGARNMNVLNNRIQKLSFGVMALSGVFSMFGDGPMAEVSGAIMGVTGAFYALSTILEVFNGVNLVALAQKRLEIGMNAGRAATSGITTALDAAGTAALIKRGGPVAGKAGGVFSKFTGFMSKILPGLARFGAGLFGVAKGVTAFLGPVGLAITAVTSLAGVAFWLIGEEQKRQEKIKGFSDAVTVSTDKLNSWTDMLGLERSPTAMQGAIAGVSSNLQDNTVSSAAINFAKDDTFKTNFADQIKAFGAVKTKVEGAAILSSVSSILTAQGARPEQIESVIKAIQIAAANKKVKIEFASIDFSSKKGRQGIADNVNNLVSEFGKEASKPGTTRTVRFTGRLGSASKEVATDAFQGQINQTSATLVSNLDALNTMSKKGLISATEYSSIWTQISDNLKKTSGNSLLLSASISRVATNFSEFGKKDMAAQLNKAANSTLSFDGKMFALQITTMGMVSTAAELASVLKDLEMVENKSGTPQQIKDAQARIDATKKRIAAEIKANKAAADAAAEQNTSGQKEKSIYQQTTESIKNKIKEIYNANKAYDKLKKAGIDSTTAAQVANDSMFAEAIAKTKVGSVQWKNLIKLVKEYRAALLTGSPVDDKERMKKSVDMIIEKLNSDKNVIELEFKVKTEEDERIIRKAQEAIDALQFQSDDYEAGLVRLEDKEQKINDTFDKRIEALDAIQEAQKRISEQKDAELSISQALARGDVGAAALAIQEEQQRQAEEAFALKKESLQKQRDAELEGLTAGVTVNGKTVEMTRLDIEKKIKDIKDQIFKIEEDTLEPAAERIRLLEVEKNKEIDKVNNFKGLSVAAWEAIKGKIDNAETSSKAYMKQIEDGLLVLKKHKEYWEGIGNIDFSKTPDVNKPAVEDKAKAGQSAVPGSSSKDGTSAGIGKIYKNGKIVTVQKPELFQAGYEWTWNADSATWKLTPKSKSVASGLTATNRNLSYADRGYAMGGIVKPSYFNLGGIARGTDTVPAMLTPGEFIMSKYAVDSYGVDTMKAMNSGELSGGSVYNSYSVNVNVRSDANPDQIARAVMGQIRQVNSQQLRGNRF